jgi:hypothetical protein
MIAMVSPLIVGLILLVPDKGFDLLVSSDPAPPTPPPTVPPSLPVPGSSSTPESAAAVSSASPTSQAVSTTSRAAPSRPAPSSGQPSGIGGSPAVLASGHARIINVEGFDLDNGRKDDQTVAGMDVSPDSAVTQINAMSNGKPRMAQLPSSVAVAYPRCQELPPEAYVQVFRDIRLMRVGDHICVHTNVGNCSMMTLTDVPSDAAAYLDFDFVTWGTYCKRP